jgi:hypothetical protein
MEATNILFLHTSGRQIHRASELLSSGVYTVVRYQTFQRTVYRYAGMVCLLDLECFQCADF